MDNSLITNTQSRIALTPKEVAHYIGKSVSWVYKYQNVLGVKKLKGSLFFPNKEELYERLFHQEEGVEVRLHAKGKQAHGSLVQNQNRSQTGRSNKKKGTKKSHFNSAVRDEPNRHSLFNFNK